ncbi:MAG: hypothetical protein AB7E55_17865 [Pigmentiphaga sp.]
MNTSNFEPTIEEVQRASYKWLDGSCTDDGYDLCHLIRGTVDGKEFDVSISYCAQNITFSDGEVSFDWVTYGVDGLEHLSDDLDAAGISELHKFIMEKTGEDYSQDSELVRYDLLQSAEAQGLLE